MRLRAPTVISVTRFSIGSSLPANKKLPGQFARGLSSHSYKQNYVRRLASACWASRADRLGGKVQRSVTQALAITFALSRGFEDANGKRGLLHRGLLLWPKAGPRIV